LPQQVAEVKLTHLGYLDQGEREGVPRSPLCLVLCGLSLKWVISRSFLDQSIKRIIRSIMIGKNGPRPG
jgi:hypothetical protein